MPDDRWASWPGRRHPPACTCVDCNNKRLGKKGRQWVERGRRSDTRPRPSEYPGVGLEWRQCRTCEATGRIIKGQDGKPIRCPTCQTRSWLRKARVVPTKPKPARLDLERLLASAREAVDEPDPGQTAMDEEAARARRQAALAHRQEKEARQQASDCYCSDCAKGLPAAEHRMVTCRCPDCVIAYARLRGRSKGGRPSKPPDKPPAPEGGRQDGSCRCTGCIAGLPPEKHPRQTCTCAVCIRRALDRHTRPKPPAPEPQPKRTPTPTPHPKSVAGRSRRRRHPVGIALSAMVVLVVRNLCNEG